MMLSRNLIIASAVVFLATSISTAPVEEKEPEETDSEPEEGEEEVSEEEPDDDDDDDPRGQDLNQGTGAGVQHATTVSKGLGASPRPSLQEDQTSNGQKLTGEGAVAASADASSSSVVNGGANGEPGSDITALSHHSSSHVSTINGDSLTSETSVSASFGSSNGDSAAVYSPHLSPSSPAGEPFHESSQIEAPGSSSVVHEAPELENNGNGHKHLIGGPLSDHTGVDQLMVGMTQTDVSAGGADPFGGGAHVITGQDHHQANTEFFMDLMGGMVDGYGPDTPVDTIDVGLDPGQPSSSSSSLDAASTGLAGSPDHGSFDHHSPDRSGSDLVAVDHTHLDHVTHIDHTGLDYWPEALVHTHGDPGTADHDHSSSSHSALDSTDPGHLSDIFTHVDLSISDYPEGGADMPSRESAHSNGNGRHRPVTEPLRGDQPIADVLHDSSSHPHHQVTGGGTRDNGEAHSAASPLDTTAGTFQWADHTYGTQTDTAGGPSDLEMNRAGSEALSPEGELVTGSPLHVEATAMADVGSSHPPDLFGQLSVTESQARGTDSGSGTRQGFTVMMESHSLPAHTDVPATEQPLGIEDQTGVMASVTSAPQGTITGSGQLGVTEQTQSAVSAGEQYNTSGPGLEGAENVELEDTC